ncbi:MAG: replication-associated recombination protein A, partial [Deinococcus sp.]|nr:replication-associated recombination protein A [Deinococcus sp.]
PPAAAPLADRMRPRTLEEFVGQEHLVGPGAVLRRAIEADQLSSLILWGPPGTGKTTLARLLAEHTKARFVPLSAVEAGVKDIRQVVDQAREALNLYGQRTIVFVDEVHRFNKAQQDAFLPHVEAGTVILVGATTENPSFEVNAALLSRCQVYVLYRLEPPQLEQIIERTLHDPERGLGGQPVTLSPEGRAALVRYADGDARQALQALELAVFLAPQQGTKLISAELVAQAVQRAAVHYDYQGEEHYNLISALHKAVRGSDPDGALYWLVRLLEGGADPVYVARRLVRAASEDVGLADPQALVQALAAKQAVEFIGLPEGALALAQAAVYLALAPKSNALYRAYGTVRQDLVKYGSLPVPLHIRNAPTALMSALDYGKGYVYDHDREEGIAWEQSYLPEALAGAEYYQPTSRGLENELGKRLQERRARRRNPPP